MLKDYITQAVKEDFKGYKGLSSSLRHNIPSPSPSLMIMKEKNKGEICIFI